MSSAQNSVQDIDPGYKQCQHCGTRMDATSLRCSKCRASLHSRRRIFRSPSDYLIAIAFFVVWWMIAFNGFSTTCIALADAAHRAEAYHAELSLLETAIDYRFNVWSTSGCLSQELARRNSHALRICRLRQILQLDPPEPKDSDCFVEEY